MKDSYFAAFALTVGRSFANAAGGTGSVGGLMLRARMRMAARSRTVSAA